MRAGKRAARREVQKHKDFTEGHYLAKKSLHQRIGSFNVRGFYKQLKKTTTQSVGQKPQFYVQPTAVSAGSPPVVRRLFEVNSEPHTGARPSVRLCVGLITGLI